MQQESCANTAAGIGTAQHGLQTCPHWLSGLTKQRLACFVLRVCTCCQSSGAGSLGSLGTRQACQSRAQVAELAGGQRILQQGAVFRTKGTNFQAAHAVTRLQNPGQLRKPQEL